MSVGDKGTDINRGGKSKKYFKFSDCKELKFKFILVILPQSALDLLTRLQIQFPMLFKLTNKSKNRLSHCGVLEFSAEEGRCYIPHWVS